MSCYFGTINESYDRATAAVKLAYLLQKFSVILLHVSSLSAES